MQWLRDNLQHHPQFRRRWKLLADSVPDNGGVVFVPAFVGLGAPHWDPYARGLLIGLERGTQPAHRARRVGEHRLSGRRRDGGNGSRNRQIRFANCASMAARRRTTC